MNPAIFDKPSGVGALLGPGDIATPTAGYSLRYLSINYIGQPVVEVRKDVAGNPTQLFTPNQLTDGTLAAFADGNNCYVSKWYDQFGSNDATQATAAAQPKIWDASTGLVTENGRPSLDFDGVDDALATPDYIVELSQNNATVFAVRSVVNISEGAYLLSEADAVLPYSSNFILGDSDASSVLWVNTTEFGSITVAQQDLLAFTYDGTNFQAYLNGATSGSAGTATVNSEVLNTTAIGSRGDLTTTFFTGKIQEIITYKSDQSANRVAIENNINAYYDIY